MTSIDKTAGGVTVKDVEAAKFIAEYAKFLKRSGSISLPSLVDLVKTASFKQLSPADPDWYYIRIASIARHLYLHPGIGVGSLQKRYGGARRNGVRPNHHADAPAGLLRDCVQALEKIKVVEKLKDGRELDRIAGRVAKKGLQQQ